MKKAEAKKKAASLLAAAEAKARKAKQNKQKDASRFNQVSYQALVSDWGLYYHT